MRRFYLHTYDRSKTFDLNTASAFASEPSGLGNAFSPSYKESDTGKHLTNVTPSFPPITLKVYFNADGTSGYVNYKSLILFLAECGTSLFLLEYNDGVTDKFCDVILKSATKSEKNENGVFCETLTLERQTYWYEEVAAAFELKLNNDDTLYPLSFPFRFVGMTFSNSIKITNPFFEPAPVFITIKGYIENPVKLYIKNTSTGEIAAELQLSRGIATGETVVINPDAKKITVTDADGNISNGYGLTDKTKQSFLYLPHGEYFVGSSIAANDNGSVEISIKRYLFD